MQQLTQPLREHSGKQTLARFLRYFVSGKACLNIPVSQRILTRVVVLASVVYFSPLNQASSQMIYTYSYGFSPQVLVINRGDRIGWANFDNGHDHTFTSDLPKSNSNYWDTSSVPFGPPFHRIFSNVGTFTYHDKLSSFTGKIIVAGQPSVTITSPTNGAMFMAPAWFSFTANPTNADSVQFYIDGTFLGYVDTFPPYTVSVTNVMTGTHQLTVVASDALDYLATNSIYITVNPPEIRLESPRVLNGQFIFDAKGLITGESNVLQKTTNLINWVAVQTNVALSNSQTFSNSASANCELYRMVQPF